MAEPLQSPPSILHRVIQILMRFFFHALYHSLAGTYDLVASTVSVGRWTGWVTEAARLVHGQQILELGFGPGHLQKHLLTAGMKIVGLDESKQMTRQAFQRLNRLGLPSRLVRGLAQDLPFQSEIFDCVVATFPTPYIIDPDTLAGIFRTLRPGGRLVVLAVSWLTGKRFVDRVMALLFQITGQVPGEKMQLSIISEPYQEAGFQAKLRFMDLPGSRLMFIIATK